MIIHTSFNFVLLCLCVSAVWGPMQSEMTLAHNDNLMLYGVRRGMIYFVQSPFLAPWAQMPHWLHRLCALGRQLRRRGAPRRRGWR